jgi:small subunit ribosomal protein S13
MRFMDLNASDQEILKNYLLTNFTIGTKLTNKVSGNINALVDKGLYRGRRHKLGYPVRGQRTLSNGKTQKRLSRSRLQFLNSNTTPLTLFKSKSLNNSLS